MNAQAPLAAGDTPPVLAAGRIHVWHIRTDGTGSGAGGSSALTPVEQARASRFHFSEDRHQWVTTRLALRRLISAYAGLPLGDVVVSQPVNGKPVVAACPRLKFSVSHTGGLSLIAIALDIEVGVDVERTAAGGVDISAARLVLSSEEVNDVLALPEGDARTLRFFHRWALKEAYGKWLGTGLTGDMASITLPLDGGASAGGRPCALRLLSLPEGYAGAICVGGVRFTLVPYEVLPPDLTPEEAGLPNKRGNDSPMIETRRE